MNTKLVLSSLLLAAFAGNALADDPTVVNDHFVPTKTRAEVMAELKAFQASGRNPWSIYYQPLKYFHSQKSRAEVMAQLKSFQASGRNPWSIAYQPLNYFHSDKTRQAVEQQYLASRNKVQAFDGEDSGSFYLAQHPGATEATPTVATAGTSVQVQ
jgi:hypothetical protein